MAKLTPNLGLFKYDVEEDYNVDFSFEQALNDNWDILDAAVEASGVTAEQFDIKGDGITDNTSNLQKATDYCSSKNLSLVFSAGIYKINSEITLYRNTTLIGSGTVIFDFTSANTTDGYCVKFTASTKSPDILYQSARHLGEINGIDFIGLRMTSITSTWLSEFNSNSLFRFNCAGIFLRNISAFGFDKVFTFGDHSYVINIQNGRFAYNNTVIYYDATQTDAGCEYRWQSCGFWHNKLDIYSKSCGMEFSDCFFDSSFQIAEILLSRASGAYMVLPTIFENCYFENGTNGAIYDFVCRESATVKFTTCLIHSHKIPFMDTEWIGSDYDGRNRVNDISLINCTFKGTNTFGGGYLINTANNVVSEVNTSRQMKGLRNNAFLAKSLNCFDPTYASFLTTPTTYGTYTKDTDGNLIMTGKNYGTPDAWSEYVPIPKGKTYVEVGYWGTFDYPEDNFGYKFGFFFYDSEKQEISHQYLGTTQTSTRTYFKDRQWIPPNATYFQLHLGMNAGSTYQGIFEDIHCEFS